jgi:hypothetical protein
LETPFVKASILVGCSYLAISHATTDSMPADLANNVDEVVEWDNTRSKTPGQLRNRTASPGSSNVVAVEFAPAIHRKVPRTRTGLFG